MNFWHNLSRPFFVLAPMADVTDAAFRRLIAQHGKPDVMYTEFVSADGLLSPGRTALIKDLAYGKNERPIVAQLFTAKPKHIEEAAALVAELGFDGFDINMGCPDKAVEKQGCGAALIKNPALACELVQAAKRGAPKLPVSLKTRIGYNKNELATWLPALLESEPAAITLHLRTRKEMSDVPARWEEAKRAVEIRNALGSKTLIIGNGDALDISDARKKAAESGVDGVMLGRAIFGNPWLFSGRTEIPISEKLATLVEHAKLFEKLVSHKPFHIMKKHFKSYVAGWNGAKELRMELMESENAEDVALRVRAYLAKNER